MIGKVEQTKRIHLSTIIAAHAALMKDDPAGQDYAGRIRDVQNGVGGSDCSPRVALYVPPPPDALDAYLSDIIAFSNRDDLPVLAQAAIAHAQFESIHPFTDGNGRIGRALINTILRLRAATTRVVVPLASALVAHRDRYFDLLGSYRDGNVTPMIATFADSSRIAAAESRETARHLSTVPEQWREVTGTVRRGSAASRLLSLLPSHPILSADEACEAINAPSSSVYAAIGRLVGVDILRPLTGRKRNQVWGTGLVWDELDDLGTRIARAAR